MFVEIPRIMEFFLIKLISEHVISVFLIKMNHNLKCGFSRIFLIIITFYKKNYSSILNFFFLRPATFFNYFSVEKYSQRVFLLTLFFPIDKARKNVPKATVNYFLRLLFKHLQHELQIKIKAFLS